VTTGLKFRNLRSSPDDPVDTWPFEGVLAALERGSLPDWQRLSAAIVSEPWGLVARQVEEAVSISRPYGTADLMELVIGKARSDAADNERTEVATEVVALLLESGLTQVVLAERIGTSPSRFSTYVTGKVVPSAGLMVRLRNVVRRSADEGR
jgi:hypothetical protein